MCQTTFAPMSSLLRKLLKILLLTSFLDPSVADDRWAPNATKGPVNQLEISGNACGPAALLTSFRCGNESWQQVSAEIPGSSDKSKLLYIIRAHGLRPSTSLQDRRRWTRDGINAEDLNSIAAELSALAAQPAPKMESMLRIGRESPAKLTARIHRRLRNSLKNGLPPVLTLRRYTFRSGRWEPLQSHFITVVRVPEKLPPNHTQFDLTYFDPWGGKKDSGRFYVSAQPVLIDPAGVASCLEASLPKANIGKSKVRHGERTAIVPTVLIGRW